MVRMFNYSKSSNEVLSNDKIARLAPAAFAIAPHEKLSERYAFLPTIEIVDALRGAGWLPMFAGQGKARELGREGVQRHVVRFRRAGSASISAGDVVPELVLLNSHDGSSAYQLHAGLFRFVCGNGLVVADATFARVSIRHSAVTRDEVVDASFRIVEEVPRLAESVETMRGVELSRGEQEAFAGAAARLRWDAEALPVEPAALLAPRRWEDKSPDLWTTFNTVQENMIKGGVRGRSSTGKRLRTRGVGSVTEDTKINKALWHLAEEMKRLKGA